MLDPMAAALLSRATVFLAWMTAKPDMVWEEFASLSLPPLGSKGQGRRAVRCWRGGRLTVEAVIPGNPCGPARLRGAAE